MNPIALIALVIYWVLVLFIITMWIRFFYDLATMMVRGFRPRGFLLVVADVVYRITDPPVRAVRKVIPPIRLGGAFLDISWTVVFLAAYLLSLIAQAVAIGFNN
ncbi:MAG: YggT family protein [Microbacteriaceae bacterium]